MRFPCVHAAATTPVQRTGVLVAQKSTHPYQPSPIPLSGRPAHRPFRGLLGVHSRCGLHTRAVTKFVTVTRRLQTFCRLHVCSGCFRLERSPGGPCTHWKSAALSRRTWKPVLRQHASGRPSCADWFPCRVRSQPAQTPRSLVPRHTRGAWRSTRIGQHVIVNARLGASHWDAPQDPNRRGQLIKAWQAGLAPRRCRAKQTCREI